MVMKLHDYAWKLAGVAVGALYERLEDTSFALNVAPSVDDDTDDITLTVTYHGELYEPKLTIPRGVIEDNLGVPAVLSYCRDIFHDSVMQAQPSEFRAAAKARARELQQKFDRKNHPVVTAIGRLNSWRP